MYCKFNQPADIIYRFYSGEVLLRVQRSDSESIIVMCDGDLTVTTLYYVGMIAMYASPIATAHLVHQGSWQHIEVLYSDGGIGTLYWTSSKIYDTARLAAYTILAHHSYLTKIPHSLVDFFTPSYINGHKHQCVVEAGDGVVRIAKFKYRMVMCIHALAHNNLLPELRSQIVLEACHRYKNIDYAMHV